MICFFAKKKNIECMVIASFWPEGVKVSFICQDKKQQKHLKELMKTNLVMSSKDVAQNHFSLLQ